MSFRAEGKTPFGVSNQPARGPKINPRGGQAGDSGGYSTAKKLCCVRSTMRQAVPTHPPIGGFLQTFKAPSKWLETYYETEIIRHCYTADERAAFKARCGYRPRTQLIAPTITVEEDRRALDAAIRSTIDSASNGAPVALTPRSSIVSTTVGCISLGKTGSMPFATRVSPMPSTSIFLARVLSRSSARILSQCWILR